MLYIYVKIEEAEDYPTFQAAGNYWSLVLADYYVSRGYVIDDDVIQKIDSFKKNIEKRLSESRLIYGNDIEIEFTIDYLNFQYGDKTPLPCALNDIGIPLVKKGLT